MAVTMRIDVRDQRVRALLEGLLRRSHDLTPAMREIGEIVRESVMRNFREQRAPDGTAWKPSWRALREGGKTLIDTATLRNSIHVRPGPDRVAVGTPVEYAAVHQFGARRGSFGEHIVQVRAHRRRSRKGGEHTVRAHTRRVRKRRGPPLLTKVGMWNWPTCFWPTWPRPPRLPGCRERSGDRRDRPDGRNDEMDEIGPRRPDPAGVAPQYLPGRDRGSWAPKPHTSGGRTYGG